MSTYLAQQVRDSSHREVLGPLLSGSGPSGLVVYDGVVIAHWGNVDIPEMAFSVTKTMLSLLAGLAFDDGRLTLDEPVIARVPLRQLASDSARLISWRHLLQQTSGWRGELWGKPSWVDAQSEAGHGPEDHDPIAGQTWAYNDVRVNLLALALTELFRQGLSEVWRERVMHPLGASDSWSWHGYGGSMVSERKSTLQEKIPVVSGGAHWGGGLWISARDLSLIGELYRSGGVISGRRLISAEWIRLSWLASTVKGDYGLLWWLNDDRTVFPLAPGTGRCARGNLGRHLLWVDPDRKLTISSHWGEDVELLLAGVSAAVSLD